MNRYIQGNRYVSTFLDDKLVNAMRCILPGVNARILSKRIIVIAVAVFVADYAYPIITSLRTRINLG